MKKAELLAPVGKLENAISAIENGADALFVGGKVFNARASANNFTEDELEEIVKYATLRGVKVYVTVNVLIKENERKALYDYLKYLEAIGVHAIIVQDLGVARMARRYFPHLRLHASTQMSAHSIEDVQFLKALGFKRVVLAREMQLSEVEQIARTCDIEIEAFVHGALCYSYSGQCLMSSLIGGRSGNRGRCAQPCRMRYTLKEDGMTLEPASYLLSLKDICTLECLPELLASGVHSLKIEGRMKSPEYVASVVSTYRKYLDQAEKGKVYQVDKEDLENLKFIFNRGGFSKGYYYERGSRKMLTPDSPRHMGVKVGEVVKYDAKKQMVMMKLNHDLHPGDGLEILRKGKESVGMGVCRQATAGSIFKCNLDKFIPAGSSVYLTKNHELLKAMKATYNRPSRKQGIRMRVIGKMGAPLKVTLSCSGQTITAEGPILLSAENNPVTAEKAKTQLMKLGSTPFCVEHFDMDWPSNAYVGISQLNDVRRCAVDLLEEALLQKQIDQPPKCYPNETLVTKGQSGYSAHVTSLEQLEAVLAFNEIKRIYWEWQYDDEEAQKALACCEKKGVSCYLALPAIMKEHMYQKYEKALKDWENTALEGFLIRNMGQFQLLKDLKKQLAVDYCLNVANSESVSLWQELGAQSVCISVEPSWSELKGIVGDKERIVYGHIPVMTSSQCVLRGTKACQKGKKERHVFELEDRTRTNWQVQPDCEACVMQILSHEPLALRKNELKEPWLLRFQFTHEKPEKIHRILQSYLRKDYELIEGTTFKNVL